MFFSKISILEYLKKRRKIISVSILKNLYWLLKSLEGYFATQFLKQAISSMDQHFDSIIPDGNPEGNNTNELIDLERTKERFKIVAIIVRNSLASRFRGTRSVDSE